MTVLDLSPAAIALCAARDYEFRGELGKGAQKSAYLASDRDGHLFALKLAALGGSPDRLIRETAALQTCTHSSIASLLEAFPHQHEGRALWVVREELLSGGTLADRLLVGPLPKSDVRTIGVALAQVLEHMHERRLVHRDIKPANILFRGDDCNPVLTDFGVVRMLDQPTLTRAFLGMGPGTPAYAAPEQLNNEKGLIDWRTDQFGLAVVLSECLIGSHPFKKIGQSIQEAIFAVASKEQISDARAAELDSLGFGCLKQALQPWPVSRFRRPSQFIESLKQLQA